MAESRRRKVPQTEREYFVDDLVEEVPEFLQFTRRSRTHYTEFTTSTLGDVGIWLKALATEEAFSSNRDLIQRVCACVNAGAARRYLKDDIENNICVSFFWVLDYDTIRRIRPFLSKRVVKLGNDYLSTMDGANYRPF